MVASAEIVVLILLLAVFVWWFRRTSTYRSRRRSTGGVPGQWSRPGPTFYGQRTNVPPPRPERGRPDDDPMHPPSRRWWTGRSKQPASNDTA
jgi:hypothetical protein